MSTFNHFKPYQQHNGTLPFNQISCLKDMQEVMQKSCHEKMPQATVYTNQL
jgi:hypothetical protein